jgi:hypothetical protein
MNPTGTAWPGGVAAAMPLRVFLSHTSDLGRPDEHGSFVAAAVAAVLRARHAVTDMAYFAARDSSPAAICEEMVGQSDVYVGIIGVRYGSPVRDRPDISYTEVEFEAATRRGRPRLVFLVREHSDHLRGTGELPERRARQDAFRTRLLDAGLTSAEVATPAELELAIYQALVELGPTPDASARLAEALALLASVPTGALLRAREALEQALDEVRGPEGRVLAASAGFFLSVADYFDREHGRAKERPGMPSGPRWPRAGGSSRSRSSSSRHGRCWAPSEPPPRRRPGRA